MKTSVFFSPSKILSSLLLATLLPLVGMNPAAAGEPSMTTAPVKSPKNPVVPAEAPPSKLHALLQLDFSDHYITPRGLNVENEGLIFQPLFLLFYDLYSNEDAFLNDVTLVAGVWSSFHTNESGADPGYWNEFDPILGLSFGLGKYLKLDTTFTSFESMVDSYPTSTHLEVKLSFDDSKFMGAFALHPWIAFWQELDEKATVVFDKSTSDSTYYFTIGINPTIKFDPVKIEFPTFINLVDDKFYQQFDGSPGGSGLAVFCTGAKISVPLKFIPQNCGFWTWYAGVKYYHLDNQGLLDGNKVLTPNEHRSDLVQFHTGISIFF